MSSLRYGISALMVVLGLSILYYEAFVQSRPEGWFLGGLLIVWGFMRLWMTKRFLTPPNRKPWA